MAPDGRTAWVAAGTGVVAVDPNARTLGARADLGGPVLGLATSPHGGRVYAVLGTRLAVLDGATLQPTRSVGLRGTALGPVAVSRDGALAAVPLAHSRVAVVDLGRGRLHHRVRVKGAAGAAFAGGGLWISSPRGRLYPVKPYARKKAVGKPVKLGRGIGSGVAASPAGVRLLVASAGKVPKAALVDVATRRVHGLRAGAGPGVPSFSSDGVRAYVADRGSGTISVVSPLRGHRLFSIALPPGSAPAGVAFQPGLATVPGTDAADELLGTRLRDLLEGFGGDDRLVAGRDDDILHGDDGADTLLGGSYDDRLDGGPGDDVLSGGSGNDVLRGGDGNDTANGGTGNDSVRGGPGDDKLDGGDGDDHVLGEEGDDEIVEKGFGNDRRLYGGPGDDLIDGGRGSDLANGGAGDDPLFGRNRPDKLYGSDGNDHITGGISRDRLFGNDGNDTVAGQQGDDDVDGGNGDDTLDGGSGDDMLDGGPGDDVITGGPGRDQIDAGDGDDTINAADVNADVVDCGAGDDTVTIEEDAIRDQLVGCETVLRAPPLPANDDASISLISGTPGDDLLYGTDGPDTMLGKSGDDELFGKGGDDYVDGEYGKDVLHGGPGNDTMAGRSNDDRIFGNEGDGVTTGARGAAHIDGGRGDDRLYGNLGPDEVIGGSGDDRINVVRGDVDSVRCGPGRDTVFADPGDKVAKDCEAVSR